jgi:hypothetical protein
MDAAKTAGLCDGKADITPLFTLLTPIRETASDSRSHHTTWNR